MCIFFSSILFLLSVFDFVAVFLLSLVLHWEEEVIERL